MVSPAEKKAKADVLKLLRAHREKLSVDDEGRSFYRYDGEDYILDEKLKIKDNGINSVDGPLIED